VTYIPEVLGWNEPVCFIYRFIICRILFETLTGSHIAGRLQNVLGVWVA